MDGESIRVTRSVVLPLSEIELRVSRSSGPGGQHANTSETRVEAVFDVERSTALTRQPEAPGRSRKPVPPFVRSRRTSAASCGTASSAIERLVEKLRQALHVDRKRVPTKPSKAAKERRLEQKRRRSDVKRLRRPL